MAPQLDTRGGSIDEKLKRLDTELLKHREALKKMREGPGLVRPETLSQQNPGCQQNLVPG